MKLLFAFAVLWSAGAWADKASECTRLWALEKELGCPQMPADFQGGPAVKAELVSETNDFGPSKCVPASDQGDEKKSLKKECDDWIKEQKSDLKSDYKTGKCNITCGPCPDQPGLKQCTGKGEVKHLVR
ncbi:MAG: hypothetical protein IT289_06690 [Oligoflexia bacterium]|nr:hypothetical protein [Oligoflexia bacterium]